VEIAFPGWPVETVFLTQKLNLLGINRFAGGQQFVDIGFQIVTGGQFDQREHQYAGEDQRRDHVERALEDVA